jgi:hypothetical protein
MPNWTKDDLKAYEQRQNSGISPGAQPERLVQDDSLGEAQGETVDQARFRVSIVSYRQRLIDPDNLCPKFFVDLLRYSSVIPGDAARDIEFKITQQKVILKDCERTEIEVTKL